MITSVGTQFFALKMFDTDSFALLHTSMYCFPCGLVPTHADACSIKTPLKWEIC